LSGLELHDFLSRVWVNLIERSSGPMAFRFMLQPAMSAALAIRDGIRDARQGTPPYLWSIIFDSGNRAAHVRHGLRATSKIIVLAVILDVAYQAMVLDEFYPGEALVVGVTLGLVPYMLIRGLAARFARLLKPRGNGL
jgi:hypothetical protein